MDEDWKRLAQKYDDKDWSFSSAKSWEQVVKDNPSAINKILYVNQLRLSGNYSLANNVLKSIELDQITDDHKFVYFIHKGMLLRDQEQTSQAIESFRKSLEYDHDQTYPYIFLAAALSKQGKIEEIEVVLKSALKMEGDIDEVYYNLSLNFARMGNFYKAINYMEKCLQLDPEFEGAEIWLQDFKNVTNKEWREANT